MTAPIWTATVNPDVVRAALVKAAPFLRCAIWNPGLATGSRDAP
ncbi:MAG: hypothetical protein ACRDSH_18015 [Pseudonocardiaceae bacterium]